MWVFSVMPVNTYHFYKTYNLIIWYNKEDEILSQYGFRKEIALSWIQKKMVNLAEKDNNNKIGIDDVTISSVVSSVGTRGSKKSKDEKKQHA